MKEEQVNRKTIETKPVPECDFRIGALEKSLERHLAWIRQSDTKAQMFIAINLAIISASISMVPKIEEFNLKVLIAILIGGTLPTWNLHQCFSAISPHLRASTSTSNLFFRDIADQTSEDYALNCIASSEADYLEDLIALNYHNATIANMKYLRLRRVSNATFISLPLLLISVSAFYFGWYH